MANFRVFIDQITSNVNHSKSLRHSKTNLGQNTTNDCTRNVKIRQGQSSTLSERAVYLAKEGRVILTGAPQLVIYPDELEEADAIIGNKGSGQDL